MGGGSAVRSNACPCSYSTTSRAKSDKDRINTVAYYRDGDRYVVFASKAGAPTNRTGTTTSNTADIG